MIRLNNQRSKIYLHDKIMDFFDRNEYKEGSYNDNWFVELCHDDYRICKSDSESLFFLINGFLSDELGSKLTAYFSDKQEGYLPPADEYCDREIEYIDWAFASEPYSCSWDVQKYREEKEYHPNDAHLKWQNNELTDWWMANKDRILREQEEAAIKREADFNADSRDGGTTPW